MTLEGDGERSNEQTKKRWKSVDEEARGKDRGERIGSRASERASERDLVGGRACESIGKTRDGAAKNFAWRVNAEAMSTSWLKSINGDQDHRVGEISLKHTRRGEKDRPLSLSLPKHSSRTDSPPRRAPRDPSIICVGKIVGERKVPTSLFGPILTPCTTTKRTTSFVS